MPDGHEVVPLINRLAPRFSQVMLTQDWHPRGHQWFASTHPGRKPFDTIAVAYGPQVLWPDHCVQGTSGAEAAAAAAQLWSAPRGALCGGGRAWPLSIAVCGRQN